MMDDIRERIATVMAAWCTGESKELQSVPGSRPCERDYARSDAVLAELGLEQVGWRNNRGAFCFGHEYHHRYDGIEWCEPVYRIKKITDG